MIFHSGYDPIQGHVGVNLFKLTLEKFDYSDFYAEIRFIKLANIEASLSDTLEISGTYHADSGDYKLHIHQIEWENGDKGLADWIYFYLRDNTITFFGRYPGQFSGYMYDIKELTSRNIKETIKIVPMNTGYVVENELRPNDAFNLIVV